MKHEFEPKGRHTQKGMTDKLLEASHKRVDEIIERTDVAQAHFKHLTHDYDTFTEQELKKARAEIDDVLFPKHHPKTPLPIPKQ